MTADTLLTQRGLERRIKRYLLKEKHSFAAITTPGFQNTLLGELTKIDGVENAEAFPGGVEFSGPIDLIYSTNLFLRTANRILLRIQSFNARSYPELYNKCRRIDWEIYCGFSSKVSFSVSSRNSRLHHSKNIESAVFSALHDHMEKLGVQVVNDVDAPVCLHIRLSEDICTVSLDSSGDLLYKRGYRLMTASAPLRETIASAVLMESNWSDYKMIMDPMCGSGSFILEAVSMELQRAPGINRQFAFFHWPAFSEQKWNKCLQAAIQMSRDSIDKKYLASDINELAITQAKENANRLAVLDFITFEIQNCLQIVPHDKEGLLVSNLPYGKRIDLNVHDFFSNLGSHLKKHFKGWRFAFITADTRFELLANLQVDKRISFTNGGIPVRLVMGSIR